MVAAFPAFKLGALLLKQVSKPIAKHIQEQAKASPVFRKYVCIPPAQFYNWCEVKSKMWILNLGRPVNIPVLNEQMAIELGANLLGEAIIFLIASGLLYAEYARQQRGEAKKVAAIEAEKQDVENRLNDLYFTIQQQETELKELRRLVYDLEGHEKLQFKRSHKKRMNQYADLFNDGKVVKLPFPYKRDRKKDEDLEPPKRSRSPPPPSVNLTPLVQPLSSEREESASKPELPPAPTSSSVKAATPDGPVHEALYYLEYLYNRQSVVIPEPIIFKALNHLYSNVYQVPLSF